jgi:uncharacterized delta-60 repeat protein
MTMPASRLLSLSVLHRGFAPRALASCLVLGLAWLTGCGDESSPEPTPQAGKGGKGGSAGKGGASGKGGAAGKGGTGGDAGGDGGGKGGSSGKGSGAGSTSTGGTAGMSGESGEGGAGNTGSGGDAGNATGGTEAGAGGTGGTDPGTGTGGTAGTGTGGTAGTGTAGTGTGGTAGDAGGGGQAGEDPGPIVFAPITPVTDLLIPGVNDLRGLTYGADGKIYASGHLGVDNGSDAATGTDRVFALVRFNPEGTLDGTFGTGGIVTHNLVPRAVDTSGVSPVVLNSGNEESLGLVQLASGEFLATVNGRDAAGTGSDVLLVKLDAAGALVSSFGDAGVKRLDLGWIDETDNASWPTAGATPADTSWGLRLDHSTATEKAVIFAFGAAAKVASGTQRTDNDRYVTRVLTSDGSQDPDFNDGKVFTYHSGGTFSDGGRRGIVLDDGSILSAGYTNFGEGFGNHVLVIKLGPNGKPDATFRYGISSPGVARYNPFITDGGVTECYALGRQSSGRIVTTGYGSATGSGVVSSFDWETTTGPDMLSVRLLPDGSPDMTFGVESALAVQSELFGLGETEDRGRDLVVLPDDRIVYAGRFGNAPAIFVAKPDGDLDEGSGVDGRLMYEPLVQVSPPLTTSHFFALAKSADSTRLVAATSNHALGVRVAFLSVGAP